ncbi:tetratricopeptide repeat protein, partial [Pseudomonas fluorescens]|uniref:tetratricopeptide repeat protein n=1 Tax=Pseudomonas fluorescens TaxID=294 RepID=UPI0012427C84
AQGVWEEARALQMAELDARRRTLGSEHPTTLTAMSNLASTLRAQGVWEEARALQMAELDARRRTLGSEHPTTLATMLTLVLTQYEMGAHEALPLIRIVADGLLKVLGAEHPWTRRALFWREKIEQERGQA